MRTDRCWPGCSVIQAVCSDREISLLQNVLALNPQGRDSVPPDLSFNTAIVNVLKGNMALDCASVH